MSIDPAMLQCPPTHPSFTVHPSIHPSIHLSIHQSMIHLSIYLSVHAICPSLCYSAICLSIHLSMQTLNVFFFLSSNTSSLFLCDLLPYMNGSVDVCKHTPGGGQREILEFRRCSKLSLVWQLQLWQAPWMKHSRAWNQAPLSHSLSFSLWMFLSCGWWRKENGIEIHLFKRHLKPTHSKWSTTESYLHPDWRKQEEKAISDPSLVSPNYPSSLLVLAQWIQSHCRLTASRSRHSG